MNSIFVILFSFFCIFSLILVAFDEISLAMWAGIFMQNIVIFYLLLRENNDD